jgi:LAGLIDADG endonuclease
MSSPKSSTPLEEFFLGLLEGDGSIQVNHWKKRYLQFRIVIKLKNSPANYLMCAKLVEELKIMNLHVRKDKLVLVEDHAFKLKRIMALIEAHGLLLTHRRRQYAFFRYCFLNNVRYSEYSYIKQNDTSWFGYTCIDDIESTEFLQLPHWSNWLCGFTEAEGCFCIRANGTFSFSIAQKDGFEILTAIKTMFNLPNRIRANAKVHFLETYGYKNLVKITSFFMSANQVGLLGQKKLQLNTFKAALDEKLSKGPSLHLCKPTLHKCKPTLHKCKAAGVQTLHKCKATGPVVAACSE